MFLSAFFLFGLIVVRVNNSGTANIVCSKIKNVEAVCLITLPNDQNVKKITFSE